MAQEHLASDLSVYRAYLGGERARGGPDLADVRGQERAKRALEVAAAGGHALLLRGPPGSGKTMLARRLPTILPNLTLEEALETTKIHSVAGMLGSDDSLITIRPFRSPHHTISDVALVGGGSNPLPHPMGFCSSAAERMPYKRVIRVRLPAEPPQVECV